MHFYEIMNGCKQPSVFESIVMNGDFVAADFYYSDQVARLNGCKQPSAKAVLLRRSGTAD